MQPGQFVDVKIPSDALLLRRPFGIANVDAAHNTITLLYRTVGEGTQILSECSQGTELSVLGPLGGHGYPIDQLKPQQKALIIGGGTGIPPLHELSRQLVAKGVQVQHVFGFANQEAIFYQAEFEKLGQPPMQLMMALTVTKVTSLITRRAICRCRHNLRRNLCLWA